MREDIFGGLQNALERGVPLEQAIRSFINAGYDEKEVRQAAQVFTEGTISTAGLENPPGTSSPELSNLKTPASTTPEQQTQLQRTKPLRQEPSLEPSKKKSFGTIIVILLAIFLVALIGALIATIFFKQDILEFLISLL